MPPQPDPQPPEAYIVHQLPGRTRLRVPSLRRNGAFFEHVANILAGATEVQSVQVNPGTGSVLLHHAGGMQAIATYAVENELFQVVTGPTVPGRRATRVGAGLPIAPLSLAAAGLVGLGVIQLVRRRVTGTATDHLWGAYQAARTYGAPRTAAMLAAVGAMQIARGRVLSPAVSLLSYALAVRSLGRGDGRSHR